VATFSARERGNRVRGIVEKRRVAGEGGSVRGGRKGKGRGQRKGTRKCKLGWK
jgi:hypothetical protein